MKIAAYVPLEGEIQRSSFKTFIVETFFLIIQQNIEHTFIIVTDKKKQRPFPNNTEIIIKPQPKNRLLKKLWWEVKAPGDSEKTKAWFVYFF